MIDHYELLGVARTASQRQIKTAYRRKAKECHPDHNPNDPDAGEKFKALAAAYLELADSQSRIRYDLLHPLAGQARTSDGVRTPVINYGRERTSHIPIDLESIRTHRDARMLRKRRERIAGWCLLTVSSPWFVYDRMHRHDWGYGMRGDHWLMGLFLYGLFFVGLYYVLLKPQVDRGALD